MATATMYAYETAKWCNGCHRVVVMPERHSCPTPLLVTAPGGAR